MALGIGSIVTLKASSADLPGSSVGPDFTPQPPKYGKVLDAVSGYGVLWEDGILDLQLPADGFDDLYSVSGAERTRLWGSVVKVAGESDDYTYIVTSMFRRGNAAAVEKAVLRAITQRVFREVRCAQLVPVAGR